MKEIFILLMLSVCIKAVSQETSSDPAVKAKNDSIRLARIEASFTYPLIKNSKWSGVIPVNNPDEKPDPKMKYKLLFDLSYNNPDSIAKDLNGGLAEIGRIINLHVAAGVPVNNIEPVILVHAKALNSFLQNEYYMKKYKSDNPNISFIYQLKDVAKVRFIACGQAMAYFNVPKDEMLKEVKVTLSAKVTLSTYLSKGFIVYTINEL